MNKTLPIFLLMFAVVVIIFSCSNDDDDPATVVPVDPCAGKTIVIDNMNPSPSDKCASNGTVIIQASGSTGFTYSTDGKNYKKDSIIFPIPSGAVTIYVKDGGGCIKTKTINVPVAPKGPMFTKVAAIISTKCNISQCHGNGTAGVPQNIMDEDCEIVTRKAVINTRAVVGNEGGLTQTEKDDIANWIAAGGKYVN